MSSSFPTSISRPLRVPITARGATRQIRRALVGLAMALIVSGPTLAETNLPRSASPEGARVYFITPTDGEVVGSPVTVRFGLHEMGVAPAGVATHGTGHHHLIIDAELPPANLPIPKNENYRHFGMGQTQVDLELAPGKHTLQLILGDHLHMPHDPLVVSERITIEVKQP